MQALTEGIFSQLAEPNSCQFCMHAKKGEPGPRMLVQHFLTASLLSTIGYNSHAVVL